MAGFTTWAEGQLADWAFNGETFEPPPTTLYMALHDGHPGENGDQNEVGAADYGRLEAPHANWSSAGTGPMTITLTTRLEWPEAQTDWGTITWVSIWDGPGGSANPILVGQPEDERPINEGDVYEIPANETIVNID